jgi:iron(III) transport system permease protein
VHPCLNGPRARDIHGDEHGLEDVARSLGQNRLAVFWRVTRPLVTPGLTAAFCLVFLSAVTELTATLILVPTGVQTLATQFWNDQQNLAYGQAAPFALRMIAIAAVPSYVLGRFFDRRALTAPKLLRRRSS